jgi:hypothetical protein
MARLAVASPGAYVGAHDVGQVQIYEIGPGKLERRSLVSTGTTFRIVALSEDGTIVAVEH